MAKDLADLVVTLELQSAKYQQGFDQATARLNKFHKDTGDTLGKIGDLFAGALSADAILHFADSTINAAADLENFSKASGIAVEQLSALQFAAKAGGVGTDGLTNALKKLNVAISDAAGNADSKAATAFQLLGISAKDANGHLKDANTVFNEVADKFANTADGANKVALAVALFGKAGEELIPTLDKGSAGLKQLADDAAAAGAIIDGPTAAAAEAFRLKLDLLKTTLIDGIGTQVEKALLPVLNSLASEFLGTAKSADNMRVIVEEVTAGFKLLISGGILVKEVFSQIGDAIGGAVAAIGAVLEGDFKRAAAILDDQSAHAKKSAEDTAATLTNVWQAEAPKFNAAVEETVTKAKASLGSLAGAEAAKAALKVLEAFTVGLQEQVAKLDQGTVAATKYKLAHGELAKALGLTGAAGQKLASQAVAAATQLETTEINKQIEGLQAQLKALSGDTAGAALDQFTKSVETLERQLKDVGGDVQKNGQAVIDSLRQQTVYQQTYNTLQTQAARIRQDGAEAEQKIADAQANGSITSIDAERQLQAIRADTISQLQGIKNGEDSVATASGNPALIQNVKAFGSELDHLKAQNIDPLIASVRNGLESAFANNFSDLITGAKSFGQAVTGMLKDIEKQFADLIAKNFAESLFGAGTGGSGGGALGGLAPMLAGLFGGGGGLGNGLSGSANASINATAGSSVDDALAALAGGAHANGGIIPAGKIGLVGERGPELVMGAQGGTNVIPNGQGLGGDVHVHNTFVIQSQNGQISRPSQQQTSAAVGRTVGAALSRNTRG